MFPLFVNLRDRLVVVVGGGPVGQRKAVGLLEAGARVRVVCLEARPEEQSDPHLEWITAPYTSDHLTGAALVFAAGPPDLNARVVADARALGIWVNSASAPDTGDFLVPATVQRGDFVLAVSTGGAAPSLAKAVCRRLEDQFDEAFATWVALLAELRPLVLARIDDPARRRELFERWARWEWLERIRTEGVHSVRAAMEAEVN
jgi:precorrin-2 dehydrogenase/sirohydrochlorin ferrochelatase